MVWNRAFFPSGGVRRTASRNASRANWGETACQARALIVREAGEIGLQEAGLAEIPQGAGETAQPFLRDRAGEMEAPIQGRPLESAIEQSQGGGVIADGQLILRFARQQLRATGQRKGKARQPARRAEEPGRQHGQSRKTQYPG